MWRNFRKILVNFQHNFWKSLEKLLKRNGGNQKFGGFLNILEILKNANFKQGLGKLGKIPKHRHSFCLG